MSAASEAVTAFLILVPFLIAQIAICIYPFDLNFFVFQQKPKIWQPLTRTTGDVHANLNC